MVRNPKEARKWRILGGFLLLALVGYCVMVLAGVRNVITWPIVSVLVVGTLSALFLRTVERLKSS